MHEAKVVESPGTHLIVANGCKWLIGEGILRGMLKNRKKIKISYSNNIFSGTSTVLFIYGIRLGGVGC